MLENKVGEEGLEQSFRVSTDTSRQINVNKNNGPSETGIGKSRHAPCQRSNVTLGSGGDLWRAAARGKLYRFSVVNERGCQIWSRAKTSFGYGQLRFMGEWYLAHRLAYEVEFGDIPSGLQIDHRCRVRACINAEHLEAVSPRENTLRGARWCSCAAVGSPSNGHSQDCVIWHRSRVETQLRLIADAVETGEAPEVTASRLSAIAAALAVAP